MAGSAISSNFPSSNPAGNAASSITGMIGQLASTFGGPIGLIVDQLLNVGGKVISMIMEGGQKSLDNSRQMTGLLKQEELTKIGYNVDPYETTIRMTDAASLGMSLPDIIGARSSAMQSGGNRSAMLDPAYLAHMVMAGQNPGVVGNYAALGARYGGDVAGGAGQAQQIAAVGQASGFVGPEFLRVFSDAVEQGYRRGVQEDSSLLVDVVTQAFANPAIRNNGLASLNALTGVENLRSGVAASITDPMASLYTGIQRAEAYRQASEEMAQSGDQNPYNFFLRARGVAEDPQRMGYDATEKMWRDYLGGSDEAFALGITATTGSRTDVSRAIASGVADYGTYEPPELLERRGRGRELETIGSVDSLRDMVMTMTKEVMQPLIDWARDQKEISMSMDGAASDLSKAAHSLVNAIEGR